MPRRLAALVWFIFSSFNTREMISFIIASKGWCRSRESSERVLWLAEDKLDRAYIFSRDILAVGMNSQLFQDSLELGDSIFPVMFLQ